MFTEQEIAYIKSQRLARLATAAPDGQPDVAPVGVGFDGTYFTIGGRDLLNTRKVKNIQAGNQKVALVIDDLASVDPWRPRGIRVYGTAELVERVAQFGHATYIQITPHVSWSWGINEGSSGLSRRGPHKTVHAATG